MADSSYRAHNIGHLSGRYRLELVDLFEVEREGERERAQKFKDVKNVRLLHHLTAHNSQRAPCT